VSVSYDVNGRAINESANGSSVTVAYDLDGRVSAAGALSYVRDALNGLIQSGTVGSVVTSFSYDGTGATSLSRAAFGGPTIFEQGYTRDAIGRVTQIIETVAAQVDTYGFVYDSVGRVAVVSRNGLPQATYEYDRNGNRVRVTGPSGTTVSGYDAQDRIVAQGATLFGYSRDGERRYRATGSDTTWYTYSAAGELLAVRLPSGTSIDYVVDALGRRIGKKVNGALVRAWLYRGDRTPVAELNSQQQVVSRFVYGARTNAPEYMVRDGRTYRFVTDRLGSVRLVVDVQDGTVAQRLDYDAFGQVTQNSNPGFQPFGFAGGLFDEQTGLVRFGARDYDAATGSWTTRDPAFFQGGASNLYAYANADPVNALDPSGFYTVAELQVVEDEDEGLTASEIQRFQQRLNRLKKFVCSVTSKVAIYSKRAMEILDVMHDHHLLPKGIFGDGPTIAMKGLWHITDLHPLITVALKINGLWGLNSVNWATASPAQKQLAAQVILRATEVFDRACMARDPTYKPIAPILKELLEL